MSLTIHHRRGMLGVLDPSWSSRHDELITSYDRSQEGVPGVG